MSRIFQGQLPDVVTSCADQEGRPGQARLGHLFTNLFKMDFTMCDKEFGSILILVEAVSLPPIPSPPPYMWYFS